MLLADFYWLLDKLRGELRQDLQGRGEPLSVEAQVAVGLYRPGHGASYVKIGQLFNVAKETANKALDLFVNAVLKVLRKQAVGYPPIDRTDEWDEIKASFERYWDEQTHHKQLYGEVPQGHENGKKDQQTNVEYPQVYMWTRRDIIRDYLYTP
ncbi:hypothetical protein PGT21_017192 [Puccinia graminis f. sp. tritici]|uniref:DDE Tnp4 domain-containing protein n=1 Tax=Puccinia graminis f. sp. tritici TaxID=56615 RepID=A0A5B0PUE4_PUCGR|nr:hypothetical protein PGT21_017192 [Puccinia graminis f. sp. tritici]